MLVVTRKVNETLYIGDNIEITVMEIKGSQVRIGIKAPREVKVLRKELQDRGADKGQPAV